MFQNSLFKGLFEFHLLTKLKLTNKITETQETQKTVLFVVFGRSSGRNRIKILSFLAKWS